MVKQKGSSKKNRKVLLISGAVVLITAAAAGIILWLNHASKNITPTANPDTSKPGINYSPPTEEEKQSANDEKEKIIQEEEQQNAPQPTTSNGKQKVTPIISRATSDGISAYVPSIFEEGGTCTATFTKGSTKFTKTSDGFQNASYTQCAPIAVNSSDFSLKGSWSVQVSYSSAKAAGASAPQQINIE